MYKNKFIWLLFGLIIILAIVVRLYKFTNPIADWHSWRQSDTAAVSKIFAQQGINVLYPRYYDISNVQSGVDNPNGYRFVEFPLFNVIHAALFKVFGVLNIDEWGRVTSILFSLLSTTFIFLIVKKYFSDTAALVAAFFYALLPFSVFYGRAILPDTAMIASVLGGIYFFSQWIDSRSKNHISLFNFKFLFALLFTTASLLFKPYALFFLLPMGVLALEKFEFSAVKKWQLWLFAMLSVLPLIAWRMWIAQFPEGIPSSAWLFNGGDIRFKGAYFFWIYGERISKLILGYYVVFLVMGLFKRAFEKRFFFLLSFLISSLVYLTVMARGNVQHDYYQIAIVPSLAIFIGRGVDLLFSFEGKVNKAIATVVFIAITFLMLSLSWYHIRGFFNINNPEMVEVGKKADEILPADARVIANYGGDTTFLYYVNRPGWPSFQQSTEELIEKGATHMIWLQPSDQVVTDLTAKFDVVASQSGYIILDLRQ